MTTTMRSTHRPLLLQQLLQMLQIRHGAGWSRLETGWAEWGA